MFLITINKVNFESIAITVFKMMNFMFLYIYFFNINMRYKDTFYLKISIILSSAILTSFYLSDEISAQNEFEFDEVSPKGIIQISTNANGVYFLWENNNQNYSEIVFAKRDNEGFAPLINLSNSSEIDSINPNMIVDGDNIYFTWWEKYDNGTQIPIFRATSDSGLTFGGKSILSEIPFRSDRIMINIQ